MASEISVLETPRFPEKKITREKILAFEEKLGKIPGAVFGDNPLMPLKHSFAEGVYVREIFLPKGSILTGKIHRHSHPNFLMKGEVLVVTEHGGREHLKAPLSLISQAGTKRAIIALEDTVWITVHVTNETDLQKIEDYVIAKSYADLPTLENDLTQKNCLIRSLKEKGRDYRPLLDLESDNCLLPFKASIEKLKENDISLDGLFVSLTGRNEWHVSTNKGFLALKDFGPDDLDMVGSWVATAIVATPVVAAGANKLFGSGQQTQAQQPLETPEQAAARQKLLEFANTGSYGNFTAGADIGIKPSDYNMTGIESQGQTALSRLLGSGMPGQFSMGDTALASLLNTDPNYIQSQFDPFKAQVMRQINESNNSLKRNAGFAGSLYGTGTIKGLGDIQARGNETLTAQLASLTNDALNRRLAAIPLAYQSGQAQEGIAQGRIAASQAYGGLSRNLTNAGISDANAELLRRRNESLLPLSALQSVAGQNANFGVPSVTTSTPNPYLQLLNSGINAAATYYGSKAGATPSQPIYIPSSSGSPNMGANLNLSAYPYNF